MKEDLREYCNYLSNEYGEGCRHYGRNMAIIEDVEDRIDTLERMNVNIKLNWCTHQQKHIDKIQGWIEFAIKEEVDE